MAGSGGNEMLQVLAQIRDNTARMVQAQERVRQTGRSQATGGFGGAGAAALSAGRGAPGGGASALSARLAGGGGAAAGALRAVGGALGGAALSAGGEILGAGLAATSQGGDFGGGVASLGLRFLDENVVGQAFTSLAGGGADIRAGRRAATAAAQRVSDVTGQIASLGGDVSDQERRGLAEAFLEQERRAAKEQIEVENLFGSREFLGKAVGHDLGGGSQSVGPMGAQFFSELGKVLADSCREGIREGLGSGGR